ncbi:MAG: cytochrome c [Chloroflexota bacterium]|nr:cytochrome c [Dehalococcoidia bacterium]MDW8255013.1 cytochrome c [Chloroflexota bacterium]
MAEKNVSILASWLSSDEHQSRRQPSRSALLLSRGAVGLAVVGMLALASAACGPSDPVSEGRRLVVQKGCTGCHVIPGVGGGGVVGPGLAGFASKPTIAETIPNTRDNLAQWLTNPSSLKPGTAMPSTRLSSAETEAIVAFLQTLK